MRSLKPCESPLSMLHLDITSNIEEVQRGASDFFRSQVPFATSLAINNSMRDVRRVIVNTTWRKAFTVRNQAFPGVVFRIKFSKKYDLEAELYDQLGRDFLERHVTGGIKTARGRNLAIPVNVSRTATGRIPKSKKPRVLTAKKSTRIIRGKGGKNLIIEKFKGQTIVRYVLSPSAKIDSRFRFYEDAADTFERVIAGHWTHAMDRALRTSKVFSGSR